MDTPFSPPSVEPVRGGYRATLEVLNRGSVEKHYDAYGDIEWDRPDFRIDPHDPIWELTPLDDGLARTDWYRRLSDEKRRRMGLEVVANFARVGWQFEDVLVRGLLQFAHRFPDAAPERRYAMHEAIEECHHIQMFREFVARCPVETDGMSSHLRHLDRGVIGLARTRPALFFVFVLGGEDPIDYVQRRTLRSGRPLHPLLKQIIQTHITEEARHLCFARMFIGEEVKRWSAPRRHAFGIAAAPILNIMCRLMLLPRRAFVERHQIPDAVLKEAYESPEGKADRIQALAKIRDHFREVGLFTRDVEAVWRNQGIA